MLAAQRSRLSQILLKHEPDILRDWIERQSAGGTSRPDRIRPEDQREESRRFLGLLREAQDRSDGAADPSGPEFEGVRTMLGELSRSRAVQGFSPTDTATFVLSLKDPLFTRIRQEFGRDAQAIADETWAATLLLDRLGLFTMEIYQKSREEIISRQEKELLELSTPVVQVWDGIVAVPLIGTLDSNRTQVVMENLLQEIVATGATIAIIDITGVPTVDTLVAQHLLKTVAAARLMGADCIISGIRAQIAQTIVHLGVNLQDVTTKATLAGALAVALQRRGLTIVRATAHGATKSTSNGTKEA